MADPSAANRDVVRRGVLGLEGTRYQYLHGVNQPDLVAPESYMLDVLLMQRPGNEEIQLDLFLDYRNNLTQYPAFQAFFKATQVPTLVIWGQNDPFFIPPGAHAYKTDNANAVVELLDTGHFALETHAAHIAQRIHEVLGQTID